ncbi:hypothetical protein [Pedosphaera parvula]|uniref:hypothetical protein n=1 Tax=Pedosphaera parvula TaxID=1032527 RepID=UPI0001735B33|nr:hypothetical protein [Pedosphaera parvula]
MLKSIYANPVYRQKNKIWSVKSGNSNGSMPNASFANWQASLRSTVDATEPALPVMDGLLPLAIMTRVG